MGFNRMPEPSSGSTTATVVTGASWSAVTRVGLQLFSVASATVLARFVSQRAYGLAGMAQVVIGFAALFGSLGTSNAIIRQKDLDDDVLTSIFWLTLAIGVCVTVACFLSAPYVAKFYNEPSLPGIFRALGLYFTISATASVHGALMNRDLQFARMAVVDLVAGATSATVGIVSAVLGAGVWSLITGALANAVVTAGLYITLNPWRPSLRFSFRRLGPVLGFGLNLSGSNIVNYFSRNTDNLLIGKYLGAVPLAYYNWGYTLMLYPLQAISWTLGRVLFPTFSLMQDDPERFQRAYLRACATVAFVTFPLMAGVTALAPEFIVALLGPNWAPVAPILRILAPVGLLQSITSLTGYIYMAMGKTDLMFRWGLLFTGLTVAGFALGLHWGIAGVATSYAIVTLLTLIPVFWIPFQLIRLRLRDLWIALWPVTRATAAMAIATAAFRRMVMGWVHLPPGLALLVFVPFGAAVYFATMYWLSRPLLMDLISLARAGLGIFGRGKFRAASTTS
jgi:PST family polysaccharide transporter